MGLYAGFEEGFYDAVDWLESHGLPFGRWFVEPVESRGVPSFPVAAVLLLAIAGGLVYFFAYAQQPVGTGGVSFKVLADGAPADGVAVSVYSESGDLLGEGVSKGGVVSFPGLASGTVILVKAKGDGLSSPTGGDYSSKFKVVAGKEFTVSLVKAAQQVQAQTASFTVHVADASSSEAIEGALVSMTVRDKQDAYTDAGGDASFTIPADGTAFIKVSADGYVSRGIQSPLSKGSETVLLRKSSSSGGGTAASLVDSGKTTGGGTVKSKAMVFGPDGTLLPSGTLKVFDSNSNLLSSAAVSNGEALVDPLPDGSVVVVEDAQGVRLSSGKVSFYDQQTGVKYLDVFLDAGKGAAGMQALEALLVLVYDPAGLIVRQGSVDVLNPDTGAVIKTIAVADGRAVLSGFPPGTSLKLVAKADGLVQTSPATAVFGTTDFVTIRLSSTGVSFQTTVNTFSPSGAQLPSDLFVFSSADSFIPVLQLHSSGVAAFNLTLGNYSLNAIATGYPPVSVQGFPPGSIVNVTFAAPGGSATICVSPSSSGSWQCTQQQSSTGALQARVVDETGAAVPGAVVSVRQASGFSFLLPAGTADANGIVQFSSVPSNVSLVVSASSGAVTNSTAYLLPLGQSGSVTLALTLKSGSILVRAFDASTQLPLAARAALVDYAGTRVECTTPCALPAVAGEARVSLTAAGYAASSASVIARGGETMQQNFFLFPAGSGGERVFISFLGVYDSRNVKAGRVKPGKDYKLSFLIRSYGADSVGLNVRVGEAASVASEPAGIREVSAPNGSFVAQSVSYNPGPACSEANSPSPDGLFKWTDVSFVPAPEVDTLLSFPLFVKANASADSVRVFYRAYASFNGVWERVPPDTVLGSALQTPQLAACYAASDSSTVFIAPASESRDCEGPDGEIYKEGQCFGSDALKCSNGAFVSDAVACPCPSGTSLSEGRCVPLTCSDGTALGSCSATKPLYCELPSGGSLLTLSSRQVCGCPTGSVFVPESGACVDCGGNCAGVLGCRDASGALLAAEGQCAASLPPLKCSGGVLSKSSVPCGCPSGFIADSKGVECVPAPLGLLCIGSDSRRLSPGQCDSSRPKRCVVGSDGRAALADDAEACSCDAGLVPVGGRCVLPVYGCRKDDGSLVTPGCISDSPPLYCSSRTWAIAPNASACPCPAGKELSPDGLACVLPGGAEAVPCDTPGVCLEDKPLFCRRNQGNASTAVPLCSLCESTPFSACGGDPFKACSAATGFCEDKRCSIPAPDGTAVNTCIPGKVPSRCQVNDQGSPVVAANSSLCGCPSGKKPDYLGAACIKCVAPNCAGEENFVCKNSTGAWIPAGCLDSSLSTGIDAIKSCKAGPTVEGTIAPDVANCGCPEGLFRTHDGTACTRQLQPIEPTGPSLDETCPGCTAEDVLRFNAVTGQFETGTGKSEYAFYIDPIYPADAMPFKLELPARTTFAYRVVGTDAGAPECYGYDAGKAILYADLRKAGCQLEVRGNKVFRKSDGVEVTSDKAKLSFVPSRSAASPFNVTIVLSVAEPPVKSVSVVPPQVSGPASPQLLFAINQLQTSFKPGGRDLKIGDSSVSLRTAGAKPVVWKATSTRAGVTDSGAWVQEVSRADSGSGSYFGNAAQVGERVSATCSDAFCCAGRWCDATAASAMASAFKNSAADLAARTAFRRGGGKPFTQLERAANPQFEFFTAAGVVEGSDSLQALSDTLSVGENVKGFSLDTRSWCYSGNPIMLVIRAASTGDGKWAYSAWPASLAAEDYLAGGCSGKFTKTEQRGSTPTPIQPLCEFLYSGASCIESSLNSVPASNIQASSDHAQAGRPKAGTKPPSLVETHFKPVGDVNSLDECTKAGAAFQSASATTDSACGPSQWSAPVTCSSSGGGLFGGSTVNILAADFAANDGSILAALTKCENEGTERAPGELMGAPCWAAVKGKIETVSSDVKDGLDGSLSDCKGKCTSAAMVALMTGFLMGGAGGAQAIIAALLMAIIQYTQCTSAAESDYANKFTLFSRQLDACKKGVDSELLAGDKCEKLATVLPENPPTYPVQRSAWLSCYAYRGPLTTSFSTTSPTTADYSGYERGCKVTCSKKTPYLEMATYANQLYSINHAGISEDCSEPAFTPALESPDPATMYYSLADYKLSPLDPASQFLGVFNSVKPLFGPSAPETTLLVDGIPRKNSEAKESPKEETSTYANKPVSDKAALDAFAASEWDGSAVSPAGGSGSAPSQQLSEIASYIDPSWIPTEMSGLAARVPTPAPTFQPQELTLPGRTCKDFVSDYGDQFSSTPSSQQQASDFLSNSLRPSPGASSGTATANACIPGITSWYCNADSQPVFDCGKCGCPGGTTNVKVPNALDIPVSTPVTVTTVCCKKSNQCCKSCKADGTCAS